MLALHKKKLYLKREGIAAEKGNLALGGPLVPLSTLMATRSVRRTALALVLALEMPSVPEWAPV